MYMLETNVIVKAIRGKESPMRKKLLDCIGEGVCISSITYTELLYGVFRSSDPERNLSALQGLLSCIPILPFDQAASVRAGQAMASLVAQGLPIGDRDVLIAGHALSLNLPLVTHNVREFCRVPGLLVEDWQ